MNEATVATLIGPAVRRSDAPGHRLAWILMAAAVLLLFVLGLVIGVVHIPLDQIWAVLTGGTASRVAWTRIVLEFRLPRVLAAAAAGASLGMAGLLLQTMFRNPLADPWFLGLVHSARLGVAVFVVLAGAAGQNVLMQLGLVSNLGLIVAAGAGALLMTLVLTALAPRVSAVTLLLAGLMLGQAAIGLINIVLHFTSDAQARAFVSWDDGNFVSITLSQLRTLWIVTICGAAVALVLASSLNVMLLGDQYARTLGIAVNRIRVTAVAVAALLAGAVTAYCGPIAFLGILAPHLARGILATADHRHLVPAAALMGAALALTADLVTNLPWSRHFLHLNAMLGLVGAPVVLILLLRSRSLRTFDA